MNARLPDPTPLLDPVAVRQRVDARWQHDILPALQRYIAVPAKSPMFDPEWAVPGHLETVLRQAADWVTRQPVQGLTWEIVRLQRPDGSPRTPVLLYEVPARAGVVGAPAPAGGQTVLMYGHSDKQPEFSGWRTGLGPWTPRLIDDRLYGRGGADDGYAVDAAPAAIEALQASGRAHRAGARDRRARTGRQRLERPGHRALVRAGAARRQPGALRRALWHHWPGRHHSAQEHAQRRFSAGADDGVRGFGAAESCTRPQ